MKKYLLSLLVLPLLFLTGCKISSVGSADGAIQRMQEVQMKEAVAQTGLPSVNNFQEKKLVKMLYELRDQEDFITYVYLYNQMAGDLVYLGKAIGYGIPYAAQYSNPERVGVWAESPNMPQPEPNGLFMPESAQATWVMLVDPKTNEPRPVFVESDLIISPFRLK